LLLTHALSLAIDHSLEQHQQELEMSLVAAIGQQTELSQIVSEH
jgi:hypothetical protein